MNGTTIDSLVSEVMHQLKGFVPAGGVVHFELNIGIGSDIGVYDSSALPAGAPCNVASFDVVMLSESQTAFSD